MNHFFKSFDWSFRSIAKVLGVFVLGALALGIVGAILSFVFRTVVSPIAQNFGIGGGGYYSEMAMMDMDDGYAMKTLSASSRNILPPMPGEGSEIIDLTAEDYEVKSYSASFAPRDKTEICGTIFDLKSDREIVFSNSNESDSRCNFTFEVPNARADEIVTILESLDPENLSSSIYTIQKSVEGTSDQLDILGQKLAQTESTLADATKAYEELMTLATNSRDVENLTQLIRLKIEAIEQLAQTRISTNQQIQQVRNSRAEQLHQIANTTFNVSVYEQKFIDWKIIANDWKNEVRNFVNNLTDLTQFVSIKLVNFVLYSAAAILYLAIVFGFLKIIWLVGKKVWKYQRK